MRHFHSILLFCLICLSPICLLGQVKTARIEMRDTTTPKFDSLKAVLVTATLRPRLKGDTLEYNVENLASRKNSVIEDLLRRLPGLQIDMNGNITYNGEKIQHLLVDGEDIFGSAPTLVTRNLLADKIAKVQILDRMSDRAVFTGIDDGLRTKTLNLVLKGSAKNGYFGKAEAGGNTDGYYNGSLTLAGFRQKEQLTAFGFASNTGGLGINGASDGGAFTGISFVNGNADALGASAGSGIPRFVAGALHYANTWNRLGDHLSGNYQYSHFQTEPVTETDVLQTLSGSLYASQEKNQSWNQQDQHIGYGIYDLPLNRRSAFKLTLSESDTRGQNRLLARSSARVNDTLVNDGRRTIEDQVMRNNLGMIADWKTGLGKDARRILSAEMLLTNLDVSTTGQLYSVNNFYGSAPGSDTVDQRKRITDKNFSIGAALGYTQPIWKGGTLAMNYSFGGMHDLPTQETYNRGDGKYDELVDSLSSRLNSHVFNQGALLNLQGKTGKMNYTVGVGWGGYTYRQEDLLADSIVRLHFFSWTPKFNLSYLFSPAMNLQFNYSAAAQQPSIAQLAPVRNNNDPLHLTLGNPDLKTGTTHNFQLAFHRLKTLMVNFNLNLAVTNNSISVRTITDSLGRQVSQPVNVNGGKNLGANLTLNRKVEGIDMGFHVNGNFARTESFVNADLSRNDGYTAGGGLNLSRYVADQYRFFLNTNFVYFNQVSSVNPAAPLHYWTQNHSAAIAVYLLKGYELNTSASYTWQEKTAAFAANTSVLLWSAFVSRNFLQDRMVIKVQINNILNQNSGISRSNVNNVNTQSSTNILGRYWMLSIAWHFDKKFKEK